MVAKKKNTKKTKKIKQKKEKKKEKKQSKLGYFLTMLILIPVFYGISLCGEQTYQSYTYTATEYKDLEIPISDPRNEEQIIHHTGYTVSYNKASRNPNWVAYELTRKETEGDEKRSNQFTKDPLVQGEAASNSDYARSGYDKGHMAPAADMKWSSKVMKESFLFSNVSPQHPDLNRRKWKDLESKIRNWAVTDSAIIIICGPIIHKNHRTIGKNRVVVPQQFFKVILSPYTSSPKAIAFLFNNERSTAPLSSYAVSIDSIEELTGMDLFAPLPDELEQKLEASFDTKQWKL